MGVLSILIDRGVLCLFFSSKGVLNFKSLDPVSGRS